MKRTKEQLATSQSLLIVEERDNKNIVIGVPHHAPAGVRYLPCNPRRPADENTGYLGYYVAEKLNCCCIIACCYKTDVNKSRNSDYVKQIAQWNPQIIVEIHGHGPKGANYDIEISGGSELENKHSVALADSLRGKCSNDKALKQLSISGDYNAIEFTAKGSATIVDDRWVSFHIELPPQLRKGKWRRGPPPTGYKFCDRLVDALREICGGR